MRELLIATTNKGKAREIAELLSGSPFTVANLQDKGIVDESDEPCMTFEGNAVTKAFYYGSKTRMLTLAEDSGLEIDALGGRPGVFTKQYAAETPDQGHQRIFDELKSVEDDRRGAQFTSVIAIFDPVDFKLRTCTGFARGVITREAVGTNGFGQDPIFRYVDSGKTGGEMTVKEKNAVSHRAKALVQAKQILLTEFV